MKDPNVIRNAVKFLLAGVVVTTPSSAARAADYMQKLDEESPTDPTVTIDLHEDDQVR